VARFIVVLLVFSEILSVQIRIKGRETAAGAPFGGGGVSFQG
jgi:hypothetical protein